MFKEVASLGNEGLKIAYTGLQNLSYFITGFIAVTLIIGFILCSTKFKDKLNSFKTLALGVVVGYAITLSVCISFFMFARLSVKGEIDTNFYLILGLFILCIIYAVSAIVTKMISPKAFKTCNVIGLSTCGVYIILILIFIPTIDEAYKPLDFGIYPFTVLLVAMAVVLAFFFGKDKGTARSTKSLAYAGICIAISFALSYIKLFSLPQGGSITLASMLPLIIYGYVFGAKKGVFVGVIYGLLQCIQSPQIYQPMQVLIDYPIAFGVLGIAGIVKNFKLIKNSIAKFIIGACIACVLRYFSHVISGYYVFSSWAMEGYSAISWSFVYNLYVIVELAVVLVVGIVLFSQKGVCNMIETLNPLACENNAVCPDSVNAVNNEILTENTEQLEIENTDSKTENTDEK